MNLTAQIPGILADAASFAVALGAIGAFVGLVSRTRPVKWAWRQLVTEPAGQVLDDRVERAVLRVVEPRMAELRSELRPNGGSSLHDRLFVVLTKIDLFDHPDENGNWHWNLAVRNFKDQAIDRVSDRVTVLGRAEDGTVEAVGIEAPAWAGGVQWHPEDIYDADPAQLKPFVQLVEHARVSAAT